MRSLLFAAVLGLMAPVVASAAPDTQANRDCFTTTQWRGWSAPGSTNVLLLRVGINDVYRVELTPGTRVHKFSDRFLVNEARGSTWVCHPVDLDLSLNDPQGFRPPLIATSLRHLTPQEVEAIPPHDRPS